MDAAPPTFGELLRRHRAAAGLTQAALAARAGLSARGVSDLERGARRAPYARTVRRLARALRLSAADRARLEAVVPRRAAARPSPPAPPRSVAGNLPTPPTSFIGRERELAEVRRLLGQARLVTLTGAGGVGKTRLALEVARSVQADYPDGVWLVELAALADPALVPQAVATALGVPEQPGRPIADTLTARLAARRLLLVLDNCEHVIDACAALADALLRACPDVRLLATSRAPLAVGGEVAWRVPSLPVPRRSDRAPAAVERVAAARLFRERARAARPGFAVTDRNAPAVAELCRRLDGIPLALELAAARTPALTVEQIVGRLGDPLRLLTGGGRTAPPRQQTLRATIDWSYGLLTEDERALLRRLAVFAGGWTLEAAEEVGAGGGLEPGAVLDRLARLVEQSLVQAEMADAGEARYRLLAMVRQYGLERLREAGEEAAVRTRHARRCLALAVRAEQELFGRDQLAWLARLDLEHDNLRAAVAWAIEADPEAAVRLVASLSPYCRLRAHYAEWDGWLARIRPPAGRPPPRTAPWARALYGAARLRFDQGDRAEARACAAASLAAARAVGDARLIGRALHVQARLLLDTSEVAAAHRLLDEALALFRAEDDAHGMGDVLWCQGLAARHQGDFRRARALLEESLIHLERAGDRHPIAVALAFLGEVQRDQGEYARAEVRLEASLAAGRELGSPWAVCVLHHLLGEAARCRGDLARATAWGEAALALARECGSDGQAAASLLVLAGVARAAGDPDRATRLASEALAEWRAVGHQRRIADALGALGLALLDRGEAEAAAARLREGLALYAAMGDPLPIAACLEGLARAQAARGDAGRAARWLAAAAGVRAAIGAPVPPVDRPAHAATLRAIRAELGEAALAAARASGRALPLDRVIREAMGMAGEPAAPGAARAVRSVGLSARERQVAERVALGLTNPQIAAELSISRRTVDRHVEHILAKLGLSARTQVAAWVVAQRSPENG
jgi:predicted ATPase/DNA-binding CsgD family transcriptional regulator/DNA-binding XRE family transcriptional regulator